MIDAPLGLAFAAGLVATVNPCGFAMLPAYLSYFMGLEEPEGGVEERPRAALARALRVGGIVSAGFLAVFGATGLLVNAGVRAVIDWLPYLALGVGVVMVLLGVAVFRGRELSIGFLKAGRGASDRDVGSVFSFGVSYAVASLSCTLPVFLSVVVGSIASASFAAGFTTYVAYGVGMSTVLVALSVALALAKSGVVRAMRRLLPHVQRISAGFLVVAGLYIIWFWADDLTSGAGEQSAVAGTVEGWSASLTNRIGDHPTLVGAALGGVVLLAVLAVILRRFEPPDAGPEDRPNGRAPHADRRALGPDGRRDPETTGSAT